MLSLAPILIAFDVLCHVGLAVLHLWRRLGLPPLPHEARETLVGVLYVGLTGVLLAGSIAFAHQ